jgi:PadR family transcriptional regulator, regulatory protein PadR
MHCMVSKLPALTDAEDVNADRWEAQLRKGTLELAILASLHKKKLYGLEILRILEDDCGLEMLEGTLYLILNRLRANGLVESEWITTGSGHPRKYYRLSSKGETHLLIMGLAWIRFSARITDLVAPILRNQEAQHVHSSTRKH